MSVHATNPPSWTVVVDDTTELVLDEGDLGGRDRIDLIVIYPNGEVGAVKGEVENGEFAMFPKVPIVAPDAKVIAEVHVKAGTDAIQEYDIKNFEPGVLTTGEIPMTGQSMVINSDDPFERILFPIIRMNQAKRADYASPDNLFKNFDENAAALNLPGYTALEDCLSMVTRKLGRIKNLRGRDPRNESVQDSYLDLAVYTILALGLAQREAGEQAQPTITLPQLEP